MTGLTLRTRLLVGLALIAAMQVVAAFMVVAMTSEELLDQIDERLTAAAQLTTDNDQARIERINDVYQGIVDDNGVLTTLNPSLDRGDIVPPPELSSASIQAAAGRPFTVEAQRGQNEYRIIAIERADGSSFVVASLLDGYEWTLNRVTRLVAVGATLVTVALALAAWWVLRLGIRPVKQMTASAEAIAAGDLSHRIENVPPGTEAGQLGAALNTMMARIESSFEQRAQAEAKLRQFIADASHELRTPVATIRGYTELYQIGGLDEPSELDDAMRRTNEESARMSRLITDMLNLARLDSEPSRRSEPIDLVAIARDAARDAAARHGKDSVRAHLPSEELIIEGDPDLLRQAVDNLVSNAFVHSDASVTVTIAVDDDDDRTMVVITDDGDGMPAEVVRHATERFFRADPSRSRHRGGSGLGLSIVAGIVDVHGGELTIDSKPGFGTTVTIALPRSPGRRLSVNSQGTLGALGDSTVIVTS